MERRPLYLHVGASKTGTSALQRGIFDSGPALARQGIGLPLERRVEHVRHLLRPLGWRPALGFTEQPRPRRLEELVARVRRTPGDRLLLTCEDLCEADEDRILVLVRALERAGVEPRVVLTVRGLVSVVPSEWQQLIKRRLDIDYPTFLDRIRDRSGVWAEQFWQRQDTVATCQRWAKVLGEDHLDVVVTPSRAVDPGGLYRLFGEVVGFDPDTLQWPEKDINASWGYTEAEVFRRLNATLGRRLPRHKPAYHVAVRRPMVAALPRKASARIPFPPEHLDWLTELTRSHVDWLHDHRVRVHGDAEGLVPDPAAARPLPELDEAELGRAAIDALANVVVFHHRDRKSAVPEDDDD